MTCRDIMTENPSCCTPSETAAEAARAMKLEDVGPIPVVDGRSSRRLVGIVTDRDLAVKVVAEGRDPNTVRLEEIMSRDVITCQPGDDVSAAMEAMADHQVRRIPIVDTDRSLVGIVAQADLARHAHQDEVGGVVEEISEPGGFSVPGRLFGWSGRAEGQSGGAGSLVAAAIGFGVGAGLMYLLDPNTGRRRRAQARDKAMSWSRSAASEVNRRARDIGNRASGMMAEVRSTNENGSETEESFDRKLVDRVRAELGHAVSVAHGIQVTAREGHVTLTGSAPAREIQRAVSCAAGVKGVKSVDNRLREHEPQTERRPEYEGENRRV